MTASIVYKGNLRCECTHLQSGTVTETDAPTDNRGKGERFSPTDTLCVALATCIITTMGIKANDMQLELANTTIAVTKHMFSDPRRIGKIDVILTFPESLQISEPDRATLQRVGDNCPVMKSLHPDLQVNLEYHWN
ncbi:MAG TPA: OsmC family protein [Ignavibacteriaceae bacterium]